MAVENKLRGISLFAAVFGELSQELPEGAVSTEELLQAAQKLIDLSKRDYVTTADRDARHHHGYYSYDLCTAFEKFQWRILESEMTVPSDPPAGCSRQHGLKALLNGARENMVLEEIYG